MRPHSIHRPFNRSHAFALTVMLVALTAHVVTSEAEEVWCVAGTSTSNDAKQATRIAMQKAREALGDRKPALVLVFDAFSKDKKAVMLDTLAESFDKQLIYGCGARDAAIGPDTGGATVVVSVFGGDIQVTPVSAALNGAKWEDAGKTLGTGLKTAYADAAKAKGRVVLMYFDGGESSGTQLIKGLTGELGADARIFGGAQGPTSFHGALQPPGAFALLLSGEFTCGFATGTGHLGEKGKETDAPEDILRSAKEAAVKAVGDSNSDTIALLVTDCISRRAGGGADELKKIKEATSAPIVGFWAEAETGCDAPDQPAQTHSFYITACALRSTAPAKVDAPPRARETAFVMDPESPRGRLLGHLGLSLTQKPDVLAALTDNAFGIVVADATPAALKALADAPDKVKAFNARGGWLMLWGVTPQGLPDFNRIVGVEHLLRPYVMENVYAPGNKDPLLKGLDGFCVEMPSNKKGLVGCPLRATDVWSYVFDTDDIAPFCQLPVSDYWGTKDAVPGSDRCPANMVNGFDDAWQLGFTFPIDKPEYLKWTFTFPRAEEVSGFSLVPDTNYHVVTKLRLSFEGSDAKPMVLDIKPDLTRQDFPIPAVKATGMTLEVLQTTDNAAPVSGIRNLWIRVNRSEEFKQKVKPLLSIGVLMKYPAGSGGIVANEMQLIEKELIADNRTKQKSIMAVLMRNLGANRRAQAAVLGNPSDWPQWRGPTRNNVSPETGLALEWADTPPPELWRRNVGDGNSSVVVVGENAYVTGCDLIKGEDSVWCLDAETGRVNWRYSYPGQVSMEFGQGDPSKFPEWAGSHSTPIVSDGKLYMLSLDGQALCIDASSGRQLWRRSFNREFGFTIPWFGFNGSPQVYGKFVIYPGGMTFDRDTGELVWNGGNDPCGSSSPVIFTKDGHDCVIVEAGFHGFMAATLPDFKPFWSFKANAAGEDDIDPIVMGDHILLSHVNMAANVYKIGGDKPEVNWAQVRNGYDSPILFNGNFYSTGGYLGRWYQCYDATTGALKWKTNSENRKCNPTFSILADGKLIVQHESGLVEIVDATPEAYQPLGSYDVRSNRLADHCWSTPALSRGRLFCRMHYGDVVALDLRPNSKVAAAKTAAAAPEESVRTLPRADRTIAGHRDCDKLIGAGIESGYLIRIDKDRNGAPVAAFQKAGSNDWAQWRGPDRSGVSASKNLKLDWTQQQPGELWRKDIGMGYASPLVVGDRLYATGWYKDAMLGDRFAYHQFLGCLNARTGQTLWQFNYPVKLCGWVMDDDRDGRHRFTSMGPRATPALDGDRLYTLDQAGEALCVDAATGNLVWKKNVLHMLDAKDRPAWYFSGSPLVLDKVVVLAVGTSGVALDKATGEKVWSTGRVACGNASPVPFVQDGQKRIAIFGADKLFTLDADTGKTLWQIPWSNGAGENRCDPILVDNDKLFVCGGYGKGSALFKLGADQPLWEQKSLDPQMGTPVLFKGSIYGPSQSQQALVCLNAADGKVQWQEAMDATQVTVADGKLVVQCRDGVVRLAEAAPDAYKPLGRFRALNSQECWTPPVIAGERLFCRSWEGELTAVDLSALAPIPPAEIVRVTDTLLENLGAKFKTDRDRAIAALSRVVDDERAKLLPLLANKVAQGAWLERDSAAKILRNFGAVAKSASPVLVACAQDAIKARDWPAAALAFQTMNAVEPAAITQLSVSLDAALSDPNLSVRRHALVALESAGPSAAPYVDAVVRLIHDADAPLAHEAVSMLRRIGTLADKAVPIFTAELEKVERRALSMEALAAMGPAAKSAVPALLQIGASADVPTRRAIQSTLKSIQPRDTPVLPSENASPH